MPTVRVLRGVVLSGTSVLIVLFVALMLGMVSFAVFPVLLRLAAPFVCPEGFGQSAVVHGEEAILYCIDPRGRAVEARFALLVYMAEVAALTGVAAAALALWSRWRAGRRRRVVVGAVLAAVLLAGCTAGTMRADEFDLATSLLGPMYLPGGADALLPVFSRAVGEPPRVLSLAVYRDSAMIHAQSPDDPRVFDSYYWNRGRMRAPTPLDVSSRETEGRLFPLAGVPLQLLPAIVDVALDELGGYGADVTHVSFSLDEPGGPLRITAHVRGLRGGGTVSFDADGSLLRVSR
jgi:hypothetical protein